MKNGAVDVVRRLRSSLFVACLAAGVVLLTGSTRAQMPGAGQQGMPGGQSSGMPNASMMSGIPMPMADVPDGTVSVRVVRGELSNVIAKQAVELVVDGQSRTEQTDDTGRAQFTGVGAGANLKAVATVGSERLESQPFTMPAKGGVRLLLAASTGGDSGQAGAPAVSGSVVFSAESRVAIEFEDDNLSVFYLLDIVNSGSAPVNPSTPIAFDLPADATGAAVLEGSSPQAQVKGRHVSVAGPFKPGRTLVQIAYRLEPSGDARTITQPFPATFSAVSLAVQKVGNVQVQCAQIARQQDVPVEGKVYVMAAGPPLPAGRPLTIGLSGLPHHETWPRTVALVFALAILGAGAWTAMGRSQNGAEARRHELEERRERLFADLLKLEKAKKQGGVVDEDAYAERRADLLATLERVYGELDSGTPVSSGPPSPGGGDRGLAA